MKTKITKRLLSLILTAVTAGSVFFQAGVPVLGAESSGTLTVQDVYSGEEKELTVKLLSTDSGEGKDAEKEIYAQADDIASLCGAKVSRPPEGGRITFGRNGYYVNINLTDGKAVLSNDVGRICEETFPLSGNKDSDGTLWLPLKKTMYLLNEGWQVSGDKILIETPPETFWNLANEYERLISCRPLVSDLVGSNGLQFMNSERYAIWSLADEIDYRLFVPFIGDTLIENEKYSDAFYLLGDETADLIEDESRVAAQLGNAVSVLRDGAENMSAAYSLPQTVSDVSGFFSEIAERPFNRWEDIKDPAVAEIISGEKVWSAIGDGLSIIDAGFNVASQLAAVEAWSESFTAQLNSLRRADISWVTSGKESAARIRDIAGDLYSLNQDMPGAVLEKYISSSADVTLEILFEKYPLGGVVSLISTAARIAGEVSPGFASGLTMGDDAFLGKCLIDISTLATNNCSDRLNVLTDQAETTKEKLSEARAAYILMIRSYLHSWDKMLSVNERDAVYHKSDSAALKNLKDYAYALSVRMTASEKYDNTLILCSDYSNLYNDDMDEGGIRERIPSSIIKISTDGNASADSTDSSSGSRSDGSSDDSSAGSSDRNSADTSGEDTQKNPNRTQASLSVGDSTAGMAKRGDNAVIYSPVYAQPGSVQECTFFENVLTPGETLEYSVEGDISNVLVCSDDTAYFIMDNCLYRYTYGGTEELLLSGVSYGELIGRIGNRIYYKYAGPEMDIATTRLACYDIKSGTQQTIDADDLQGNVDALIGGKYFFYIGGRTDISAQPLYEINTETYGAKKIDDFAVGMVYDEYGNLYYTASESANYYPNPLIVKKYDAETGKVSEVFREESAGELGSIVTADHRGIYFQKYDGNYVTLFFWNLEEARLETVKSGTNIKYVPDSEYRNNFYYSVSYKNSDGEITSGELYRYLGDGEDTLRGVSDGAGLVANEISGDIRAAAGNCLFYIGHRQTLTDYRIEAFHAVVRK